MYYLEVEEFEKNIQNVSKQEFNEFIDEELRYKTISKNNNDNFCNYYILCDNLPSNFSRKNNSYEYNMIEAILNATCENDFI